MFISILLLFIIILNGFLVKILGAVLFYVFIIFLATLLCISVIHRYDIHEESLPAIRKMGVNIYFLFVCLIVIYSATLYYDLVVLSYRFFSVFAIFVSLILLVIIAIYSKKLLSYFILIAFFLSFIFSSYLVYPPAFGSDTWRDSIISSTIITSGSTGFNYYSTYYSLPVIPILYSVISLIFGIFSVDSTIIVGIIYISLLTLVMFLIANRINQKSSFTLLSCFFAIGLALSAPLVLVWSVWFIPEAYAVVMFLLLLLILISKVNPNKNLIIILLPILIAIVLGHAVVCMWTILFVFSLVILGRVYNIKDNRFFFINRSLIILIMIALLYFLYTIVIESLTIGFRSLFVVFERFFTLSSSSSKPQPLSGDPLSSALLSYGSIAVCLALSLMAWFKNKNIQKNFNGVLINAMFICGLLGTVIGFLGIIYLPSATLDRYFVFESLLLLALVSSTIIGDLHKRGKIAKIFLFSLGLLMISSIAFGGTLTPDFNEFQVINKYSIKNIPTFQEKIDVNMISYHLTSGQIVTDRATGQSILYSLVNSRTLLNIEGFPNGISFESSDFYVKMLFIDTAVMDPLTVQNFFSNEGLLIYRDTAYVDMGFSMDNIADQVQTDFISGYNKVYSGYVEAFIDNN